MMCKDSGFMFFLKENIELEYIKYEEKYARVG